LELGQTETAAQMAIVVLAATTATSPPSQLAVDAMLTLAEIAETRGQRPLARGWLDRCAGSATGPRGRALDMRLSLAAGDLARAARAAHEIEDSAADSVDAGSLVAAAEVHARLGDAAGATRVLDRASRLAREGRRGGDTAWVRAASEAIAGRYGRRFAHVRRGRLGGQGSGRHLSPRAREAVRRLRTGEPPGGGSSHRTARRDQGLQGWEPTVVNEVVTILRLSQGDADEVEIIEQVCRVLRDLWRATSVGVWRPGALTSPAVGVGRGEVSETLAARIASVDWVVGPVADRGCPEVAIAATVLGEPTYAGVAIRYAGECVGLLVLRWSSAPLVSGEHVVAVLSAAAAALGPAVAALCDRARAPTAPAADGWGLLGASAPMQELRESVRRCATSPFPVLVVGESGSGKELVARAIHDSSLRRGRRFCAVNCAALTEELFDAELFGHARGAFTGAVHERKGLIEEADGGTLFLDEIGELSPRGQAKLLRVLQEREVRRVGENSPRRVDVRVISATNRDLVAATTAGSFRLDLLYRLDVVRILVPALRARHEDVLLLAHEYWRRAAEGARTKATLSAEVLAVLARYHWPGNVRELQNVMTSLAVSAPRRGRVERRHLPSALSAAQTDEAILPLLEARRRFDQEYVTRALLRAGGSRAAAARLLGITRQGLAKMLERHAGGGGMAARGGEARAGAGSA
jgi:DNA-binding NtrC family response regulator